MAFCSNTCLDRNYYVLFKSSRSGILGFDFNDVKGFYLATEELCIVVGVENEVKYIELDRW